MHANPQKIVVFRYRFIGDTLLTIPFLRALRGQFPQAEIHLLVGKDGFDLVKDCPYLDKTIVFEPREQGFWQSVRLVKAGQYDRAYLLKRSFSSALMAFLAGIPERIGFNTDHRGLLLTTRVPYRETEKHEAACFLDLLPQAQQAANDTLETWIPDEILQKMGSFVQNTTQPKVVLHATSTNPAKCWPVSHFVMLAEQLASTYQASLYFLGTAAEKDIYDNLITALPQSVQAACSNLCGQTTVLESLALLKQMDLVVANDSGMVHMAAACNTPLVCLFGPMDPNQWRPLSQNATILVNESLPCRPCRMKITCNNLYPCLTEITPETVLDACKTYLTS